MEPEATVSRVRTSTTFDPGQHLSKIKGQDYLEVKWRIAWLCSQEPEYTISTELIYHENGRAVVKAEINILEPDGSERVARSSTAHGSETIDGFENYIEKAETKAIGRALAALGYGTQFTDDFDDTGAIADAPVNRQPQQQYNNQPQGGGYQRQQGGSNQSADALATSAQKSMIQYKARQRQMEPEQLVRFIRDEVGKEFAELTKREASRVIDALGS